MECAAIRTRPGADMRGFLAIPTPASGTKLRGRVEPVRLDERSAFPFGFVCQLPAEFGPTDIPNRFRKFVVLHHMRTPQRLNHDDLVGEFVQEVLALVRNLFVFFCQC